MKASRKIGIGLIILSGIMLIMGASAFTYQGSYMNPLFYKIGKFSFFFFAPTLIMGLIYVFIDKPIK
jgi:hypothetical protein